MSAFNSVNRFQLLGRLGKDPRVKRFTTGTQCARLSIATGGEWTDKEGVTRGQTMWHSVDAWGRLCDIAEKYLQKGSQVYVEGYLASTAYETKSGVKKYIYRPVADKLIVLAQPSPAGEKTS